MKLECPLTAFQSECFFDINLALGKNLQQGRRFSVQLRASSLSLMRQKSQIFICMPCTLVSLPFSGLCIHRFVLADKTTKVE